MSFSRVSVKRSGTCGKISDTASLEFNVKDEVVFESFIDQNKYKSKHLEKVINRIRNLKPKCTKNLPKRLQNKPETTNKTSNQKKSMIVNHDTSLDNLIEYFLDNMEETPRKIKPTFLPLRHQSHVNDSNIRSKAEVYLQPLKIVPTRFQVHLIPITVSKQCFLVKTLQSSPPKPAPAT